MTITIDQLTRSMIETLRDEAGCAGDSDMVAVCEDALYLPDDPEWPRDDWQAAREEIVAVVNGARDLAAGDDDDDDVYADDDDDECGLRYGGNICDCGRGCYLNGRKAV